METKFKQEQRSSRGTSDADIYTSNKPSATPVGHRNETLHGDAFLDPCGRAGVSVNNETAMNAQASTPDSEKTCAHRNDQAEYLVPHLIVMDALMGSGLPLKDSVAPG